eukprot:CAMPEP_0167795200 /NCGR_PEP_ID=MMETSP0111_2-20121227/14297_1 /TAXON_ID=91324 /ORGANISM="Lotharella globosa, Strain CCCM811" /LENGTH=57 /DNA_ID=CAMNT_0007688829 /DNA_START=304 /DNA_END=477 /DNA_ORIENTATION=+
MFKGTSGDRLKTVRYAAAPSSAVTTSDGTCETITLDFVGTAPSLMSSSTAPLRASTH